MTTRENFIVTAENPAGPWSAPHVIEGCGGIDPSLFWDDDGRVYLVRTSDYQEPRPSMITMQEIDLVEFKLVGDKKRIWGGALRGCESPEAPHIYKKDGYYYLLTAEGGTEHFHAVTIARSGKIDGEYKGYAGNPILTHRNLGIQYPICNVGHGDMVELKDGSWYMVVLGSRPYGGYHKNMGRETFIAPVIWENGWPVVSPGSGRIEWEYPAPFLPPGDVLVKETGKVFHDDFDGRELSDEWNFIGTPVNQVYKLEDGCLKLAAIKASIGGIDKTKPDFMRPGAGPVKAEALAFVGRRQRDMSFTAKARLRFAAAGNAAAGLVILQHNYHQLRIELRLGETGKRVLRAVQGYCSLEAELTHKWEEAKYREKIPGECFLGDESQGRKELILGIESKWQEYRLTAESADGELVILADGVNGGFMGSETAGGFIGAYIGMFATGNGVDMDRHAAFDWFTYKADTAGE